MKKMQIMSSRIGKLYIIEEENKLIAISYRGPDYLVIEENTPILQKTILQLQEYFDSQRKTFDLDFQLKGTDFQRKVWQALETIPYGETRSYQQIAEAVGCPKGCRAIGLANNYNPISIVVPCHRVIGKNGKMVGYGGGLENKEKLLKLEKENGR